jgi:small redox-active disulfide protein 2
MVKIEVMVAGCAKCRRLEGNVAKALQELGLDLPIERIEGLEAIRARGQMRAPALYIDGELKAIGQVPGVEDIKQMIVQATARRD